MEDQDDGNRSEFGKYDANHDSDQETTDQVDGEKEKNHDDVAIVGLTPPPEEAELVHIDEQLMNIEDDLGHMEETTSDDVMHDNDMFNNNLVNVNAQMPILTT